MLCIGAPRLEAGDLQELDVAAWEQRFKVTSKLGQGGFADVVCVKDVASQQSSALKVLRTSTIPGLAALSGPAVHAQQAPEVSLFREARALKHGRHPNVVQLQSVVHLPRACVADSSVSKGKRDKMGSCWGIMLELLPGGSLQQQVYKVMSQPHSAAYSNVDALTWACDMATAVAHLHSLNPVIIHRDLKLQNFMLKPTAVGEAGGRKLPIAKLTDFGLHVMIDRPPSPFFLATGEDGFPMLILEPEPMPKQPQQQPSSAQDPPSFDCVEAWTASNSSTPDTDTVADAEARVGAVAVARTSSGGIDKARGPSVSALKGGQLPHRDTKPKQRVAFAVDASTAAADSDVAADADHLPGGATAQAKDQQQQTKPQQQQLQRLSPSGVPQQWTCLTAGTLRRLSIDSRSISGTSQVQSCPSSTSHRSKDAQSQRVAIPLMIQPPGANRSSGSFVHAAVPTDSLAFEAAGVQLGDADADDAEVAGDAGVAKTATHRYGSDGGSSSSAGAGSEYSIGDGSISSILAAANTQRDYQVHLKSATVKNRLARLSPAPGSAPSSSHPRECSSEPLPALNAAAVAAAVSQAAESCNTPRAGTSISGASSRSGDWPTGASMLWEDLMEDENDQDLLLDASVPPVAERQGSLIELPLSYNLTGHTGSFMYMAPEVFKSKPYNESVDIFSMGVMLYELFSRTLLLYTHTPANSPADCEKYAGQIAQGFRPKHVKQIPPGVWEIIESCWEQDPADRPSAKKVLRKLQEQLQQAQEAAAAKGFGGKGFGKLLRSSNTAAADAAASPVQQSASGKAGDGGVVTAGPRKAEASCGCVIC